METFNESANVFLPLFHRHSGLPPQTGPFCLADDFPTTDMFEPSFNLLSSLGRLPPSRKFDFESRRDAVLSPPPSVLVHSAPPENGLVRTTPPLLLMPMPHPHLLPLLNNGSPPFSGDHSDIRLASGSIRQAGPAPEPQSRRSTPSPNPAVSEAVSSSLAGLMIDAKLESAPRLLCNGLTRIESDRQDLGDVRMLAQSHQHPLHYAALPLRRRDTTAVRHGKSCPTKKQELGKEELTRVKTEMAESAAVLRDTCESGAKLRQYGQRIARVDIMSNMEASRDLPIQHGNGESLG
ncbi:unnamed protein product [Protopolystoma xenopodis]|uniref:Uncharacterized protein n=1 Tax=Protopolystoma xenopodis TaxID=117903 RepID=A0A448WL50_9PLAT|nr:unnamed protein product [Protopolystoma xenopodis]